MTLIVFQVITRNHLFYLSLVRALFRHQDLGRPNSRRWPWLVGTTIVSAAWLLAIMLLAADDFR